MSRIWSLIGRSSNRTNTCLWMDSYDGYSFSVSALAASWNSSNISAGASATQMASVGSSLDRCRYDTSNDCLLFTHMSLMRFLYTKFPGSFSAVYLRRNLANLRRISSFVRSLLIHSRRGPS